MDRTERRRERILETLTSRGCAQLATSQPTFASGRGMVLRVGVKMDGTEPRRERILETLAARGYVSVADLADDLGVSSMTVRRDLDLLEARGRIRRTHGGAVGGTKSVLSLDLQIRSQYASAAKARIAKRAVEEIEAGQTVFLDAGSTVLAMGEHLGSIEGLTVVTPSLPLANELLHLRNVTTVLLGGHGRHDLMSTVGPLAEQALESFHFHIAFLGAAGLDLTRGLKGATAEEIPLKRLAAKLADRVLVLASREKFGRAGGMYFLPASALDGVVTETETAAEILPPKAGAAE